MSKIIPSVEFYNFQVVININKDYGNPMSKVTSNIYNNFGFLSPMMNYLSLYWHEPFRIVYMFAKAVMAIGEKISFYDDRYNDIAFTLQVFPGRNAKLPKTMADVLLLVNYLEKEVHDFCQFTDEMTSHRKLGDSLFTLGER